MTKAEKELTDSRRKAKEINDELSRVGAFLSRPRRPSSRPGSGNNTAGTKGAAPLPPIGQKAPNTAREHRPESGNRQARPAAKERSDQADAYSRAAPPLSAWTDNQDGHAGNIGHGPTVAPWNLKLQGLPK